MNICLSLAGNNDAGTWRDQIDAAQIASLHLSGDGVGCSFIGGGRLKFAGGLIVQGYKYIPWHGNICWDALWVSVEDAIKVIELLRAAHWTCEGGESALFEAYNEGQPITAVLIEGADDATA